MILLIALISFFFVFFLGLSIVKIIQAQEEELRAKIADRLRNVDREMTGAQIKKNERLSDLPLLDRLFRKITRLRVLQNFLNQAGLRVSVGSFLLSSLLLGVAVFFITFLFRTPVTASAFFALVVSLVPYFYMALKRAGRIKKFSNRFSDALAVMASSLRAGHSLQMAIESVVAEGHDVVSVEFEKVISEMGVGQNFEDALKGMLDRMDTQDLRLFISAVVLQRETGGNLAELLEGLESVVRERQELRGELKAATAQARLSGMVLSCLPIFVGFFVFAINPDYILFFFRDETGNKLFMSCVTGQILGIFSIHKIVRMEI